MQPLPRPKAVAFDFDGTLVDSNDLKAETFFDVFADVPDSRSLVDVAMKSVHGDRHDIIRAIVRAAYPEMPAADQESLAVTKIADYGQRVEDAIATGEEIPGAMAALTQLQAAGISCYINSATPEDAVLAAAGRRNMIPLLAGVLGRPRSKAENLNLILAREQIQSHELVMVGDSPDDALGAVEAGCRFVAVRLDARPGFRAALAFETAEKILPDLTGLANYLLSVSPLSGESARL